MGRGKKNNTQPDLSKKVWKVHLSFDLKLLLTAPDYTAEQMKLGMSLPVKIPPLAAFHLTTFGLQGNFD